MKQISEEIMTIEELAIYLKIAKSTLYKQVQVGKIPGQKIGKQWRFGKQAIDKWMNEIDGQSEAQIKRAKNDVQ